MSEELWLEEVDELLSEMGVNADLDNDGWNFMFENGFKPAQAIAVMFDVGA